MTETILLTGATGFIGSHLLEALLKKDCKIIILKRSFSDTWRIKSLLPKVTSYDIDKTDIEDVFKHKIDKVVHLATYYHKFGGDTKLFAEANIEFPMLLLDQMAKKGVKFFINTGTFVEYETGGIISESTQKKAYNLYAASKMAFAEILKYYCSTGKVKALDLKLFSPYGPKDNEKLFVYMIKSFIKKTIFEITKGEQRWNWTYVKDIVSAYLKALDAIEGIDQSYSELCIGTNKVYSIREVVTILENISGIKSLASFSRKYPENEIFYANCDNSRARSLLGWEPKYDLIKGLRETYSYYGGG
ncbi:MAG: NAD(P)-dependent oxidoreductase [archaeon]